VRTPRPPLGIGGGGKTSQDALNSLATGRSKKEY
jgi:hypothetical protein